LIPYDRERLIAHDGGNIILDWIGNDNLKPNSPTLIVVPGICNSIESNYIRSFSTDAQRRRYRVAVITARGVLEDLKSSAIFTLGGTQDVSQSIKHIRSKFPESPLIGIGFSMGGNVISKYIGEMGALNLDPLIIGGISISQGFDGTRGIHLLKANAAYDRRITIKLKQLLMKHSDHFKDRVDLDFINKNIFSVEDFDLHFTCKIHGFSNTQDYYRENSSINHLPHILIPTLILNSMDDPISPHELIPFNLPTNNENIIVVTTEKGGHLGWCEGLLRPTSHWHERVALEFADAVVTWNKSKKVV